ncbi:MAG TPA: hypothetical protein VLG25_03470 [Patescibacteria group bacterium]|nr:hypothetical protein [Patescibacteria group bacterium]
MIRPVGGATPEFRLPDGFSPEQLAALYDPEHDPSMLYEVGRAVVWLSVSKGHLSRPSIQQDGDSTSHWGIFLSNWRANIPLDDGLGRSWSEPGLEVRALPSAAGIEAVARQAGLEPGEDTFNFVDCDQEDENRKIEVKHFLEHFAEGTVPLGLNSSWGDHDRRPDDQVAGHLFTPNEMKDMIIRAASSAKKMNIGRMRQTAKAIDDWSEFNSIYCRNVWQEGPPEAARDVIKITNRSIAVLYMNAYGKRMGSNLPLWIRTKAFQRAELIRDRLTETLSID